MNAGSDERERSSQRSDHYLSVSPKTDLSRIGENRSNLIDRDKTFQLL